MLRLLALLAAVLAVALAIAGCGGGGDDTSGGSSQSAEAPATEADFVKAANAVCTKGIAEIEKGFQAFSKEKNLGKGKQPDKAEQAEVIETILIPGIAKQLEGVAALPPPAGEEQAVEEFVKGAEAELKKAEKNPSLLTTGAAFKKSREEAQAIGIGSCPAG